MKKICTISVIVLIASFGFAQDHLTAAQHAAEDPPATHAAPHADEHPHPIIPQDATWAGVMVIIILLGFFLPAAVIGPVALALAPEDEPATESHDEPPGASHHHGPQGTDSAHGH